MRQIDPRTDNILISGKRGSGKSFYFEHTLFPLLKGWRVIVLDCKLQYRFAGEIVVDFEKDDKTVSEAMTDAFDEMDWAKPWIMRVIVRDPSDAILDRVSRVVSRLRDVTLVIEEFHSYVKTKFMTPKGFSRLIRLYTGTHNRNEEGGPIAVTLITHYPTDFPKEIYGNLDWVVMFKQNRKILMNLNNQGILTTYPEFSEEMDVFPKGYVGQHYIYS